MIIKLDGKVVQSHTHVPLNLARQPINITYVVEDNKLYHIIIYDPDAVNGPYLHYAAVNIPGKDINKAIVWASYQPPSLPSGSGIHRYVIIIFRSVVPIHRDTTLKRSPFDLGQFISDYPQLTKVDEDYFTVNA